MQNPKSSLKLHLYSGFHDPNLDEQFQSSLQDAWQQSEANVLLTISMTCYPIRSCVWAQDLDASETHLFIGFSAGVIRAAIAARRARCQGATVAGLIAIDGWGVPLFDRGFPIYRFSHDLFTHLTAPLLGGPGIFFADPPVEHLSLWSQPHAVKGWYFREGVEPVETTASEALTLTIASLVASTRP